MKSSTKMACVLVAASLLQFGCQSNQVREKAARFIPAEAIVGEWSGFSEEHGFCLMSLQPNGSGLFGYLPYRGEPTVLRVNAWQCEEKRLAVALAPIDQNPKGIQRVEGWAGWLSMDLTVSGPGWSRRVVFHREDDLEQRQSLLKAHMAAYKTNAPTAASQK